MDEKIDAILERLAALERRLDRLERERGEHDGAACPFRTEERRIVDLVVDLTASRVVEAIDARMDRRPTRGHHPHGPPHQHGPPPHGHHHHGPPPPPPGARGWPHDDR